MIKYKLMNFCRVGGAAVLPTISSILNNHIVFPMYKKFIFKFILLAVCVLALNTVSAESFDGQYFSGIGNVEYLQLLDISRRVFAPDPEFQNLPMLYMPKWNGFMEGVTWQLWWVQNSFGTTYCALPFYTEPYLTFLQNSQDLWFDQMGDGKANRVIEYSNAKYDWVLPDGVLCDVAGEKLFYPKQGDGHIDIHDWGMEFTAAGALMQAELLLISRDSKAISHYLPKLERCSAFIETRRDPNNNLFLAGPAGNLLAPSYAGWKKTDGTYGKAYLTGLSVTYIAFLDRLIELEKLSGDQHKLKIYSNLSDSARSGLSLLITKEGYFIKSLDPDGIKHGVYGAKKYGYFETVCNHDAICFRIADDEQAQKIYSKIVSIPGLRPHGLIITNYPSLDDTYMDQLDRLWSFGTWVNGGHWSTCEARMIMGYYRLNKYDDAINSMRQIMKFAKEFRMDNPLVDFGNKVYQSKQPINLCYDTFGIPAAMIRGLFEYRYSADGLTLFPHIPPSITELNQKFPIRFGTKKLYLSTTGNGGISEVTVNGIKLKSFDDKSVFLPYNQIPQTASVRIVFDSSKSNGILMAQHESNLHCRHLRINSGALSQKICIYQLIK